ncbi:MAG TPA: ABC transporter ATP-binding protein [Nakamurella sp.]|jgi:oligopeptide transport system ATP-binding protein|nr:ABC transporter ATP-binding protein [Nakamurella sp.]
MAESTTRGRPDHNDGPGGHLGTEPLVRVDHLRVEYPVNIRRGWRTTRRTLQAVADVSLDIAGHRTLGLVGESGSGKSTLGRAIIQLQPIASGSVTFDGIDLSGLSYHQMRAVRRGMQIVFQDPYSSLNRRMTVSQLIERPLRIQRVGSAASRAKRVTELLDLVGLGTSMAGRYPIELSGGQRQRVGIARALSTSPKFIVCDEPISALDVSIQAQITDLLVSIQQELGLTYLFIAHDLAAVRSISHEVAVMYLGTIVELADADELFRRRLHPYTKALISAAPIPDPAVQRSRERIVLTGEQPSRLDVPVGCVFASRCPFRRELCLHEPPPLLTARDGHRVACHFWSEIENGTHLPETEPQLQEGLR